LKKIIIFFLMTATGPLLPAHRCVVELPLSLQQHAVRAVKGRLVVNLGVAALCHDEGQVAAGHLGATSSGYGRARNLWGQPRQVTWSSIMFT
jgi:hypothetical protein